MATSKPLMRSPSLKLISGRPDGLAKTSATQTRSGQGYRALEAVCSSDLRSLLESVLRSGLSLKMSRGSSAPTTEQRLSQLSTNSKRSGIWGSGLRATFSARAYPTTLSGYSLSEVISPTVHTSSILTAANCLGIIRRERRNGRGGKMDPIFRRSLFQTLRFWFNVAEVSGSPKHAAIAPRYVPKLAAIKAATQTDQFYVARNLTWDECEKLMGFPEGWTVAEGDSLATP
jgi:hypothetical protein